MEKIAITLIGKYLNLVNSLLPTIGSKQTFYIFCYPFKKKYSRDQKTFIETAETTTLLNVDDGHIPLYKWGKGPKNVLFVHGWKSNTFRWKDYLTQANPEAFTFYSIDAPGHGNASSSFCNVPLYEKAIKAAADHIGNVHGMVGHSVGGFAILYFLHTYPENQPKKMVSLASPGNANDFVDFYINALNLSEKSVENLTSYFKQYAGKEPGEYTLENIMHNIQSEGLIIHDEGDKDVPVRYAKEMHALWPDSKLKITNGLGHSLKGKEVINEVLEFLKF